MNVSELTPFEKKLYWAVWTGDPATVRRARDVAAYRIEKAKLAAGLDEIFRPLLAGLERLLGGRR